MSKCSSVATRASSLRGRTAPLQCKGRAQWMTGEGPHQHVCRRQLPQIRVSPHPGVKGSGWRCSKLGAARGSNLNAAWLHSAPAVQREGNACHQHACRGRAPLIGPPGVLKGDKWRCSVGRSVRLRSDHCAVAALPSGPQRVMPAISMWAGWGPRCSGHVQPPAVQTTHRWCCSVEWSTRLLPHCCTVAQLSAEHLRGGWAASAVHDKATLLEQAGT